MRCLTLAEDLRERGVATRFVCRAHPGHLIEWLRQRGMAVHAMPEPAESRGMSAPENHSDWLGVTQTEDADQTIQALRGEHPEWLIVDHYGLGSAWERRLRGHAGKLMVIDDLANRPHDCDLLLDQNYSTGSAGRYRELVPEMAALALGPRYALLRPEYLQHRLVLRERDGRVRRVLIFFGGSDSYNMTGMALAALSGAEFDRLEVDVVIGPNNVHRARLERAIAERPLTTAYGHRPHLADLMAQADLAIGAGGTTTWERLCLGLPSLVVSIAENQEPTCEAARGRAPDAVSRASRPGATINDRPRIEGMRWQTGDAGRAFGPQQTGSGRPRHDEARRVSRSNARKVASTEAGGSRRHAAVFRLGE